MAQLNNLRPEHADHRRPLDNRPHPGMNVVITDLRLPEKEYAPFDFVCREKGYSKTGKIRELIRKLAKKEWAMRRSAYDFVRP